MKALTTRRGGSEEMIGEGALPGKQKNAIDKMIR